MSPCLENEFIIWIDKSTKFVLNAGEFSKHNIVAKIVIGKSAQ